ncbi:MAG: HepT-like ribonuclease domain-containing protein [Rickettsiales bacterium]|nr:HepT-like ribonuclease domain-containing protein [Rickettsiales bacterium]
MRRYDDNELIEFIFEFIDEINSHISFGGGKESFFNNVTIKEACLRSLHKICETTQKISPQLKSSTPEIEWLEISGMRNILVHEYLEGFIDDNLVYKVIEEDLPKLKKSLEKHHTKKK